MAVEIAVMTLRIVDIAFSLAACLGFVEQKSQAMQTRVCSVIVFVMLNLFVSGRLDWLGFSALVIHLVGRRVSTVASQACSRRALFR